jgi:hypothetical protein
MFKHLPVQVLPGWNACRIEHIFSSLCYELIFRATNMYINSVTKIKYHATISAAFYREEPIMKEILGLFSTCFSIVTLVVVLAHDAAFAYRPFSTEDAGVGALKENVLEASWELTGNGDITQHSLIHALIIGLDKAELIFEAPYVLNGHEEGLHEAIIAAKIVLFGSDEGTGLFTLKTEFSAPGNAFGLSAVGTKAFGRFQTHCQIGWCNDFMHNSVFYGLAFDYGTARWMNIVAEFTGGYCRYGHLKPLNCMAGFLFTPKERLAVDIAAGAGITRDADDFAVTSGLTFVF